jgi:hypothetical protein
MMLFFHANAARVVRRWCAPLLLEFNSTNEEVFPC